MSIKRIHKKRKRLWKQLMLTAQLKSSACRIIFVMFTFQTVLKK
jgi:hypothetical protein